MRTQENTPQAADEERVQQVIGHCFLHSETPLNTQLLAVLRDAFAHPETDAFDVECAVNVVMEKSAEEKLAETDEETKERKERSECHRFLIRETMDAYQRLTAFPSSIVASVLAEQCETRNGAFAEAKQLVAMEEAIRAIYAGLDDRTRFLVAFLVRYIYLQGFVMVDGIEFIDEIHNGFAKDGDFLQAHAQQFESDREIGVLARAIPLGEDLYEKLG